ncbi:hypothetical protein [Salinarchaeum chitinilyticum]
MEFSGEPKDLRRVHRPVGIKDAQLERGGMVPKDELARLLTSYEQLDRMMRMYERPVPENQPSTNEIDDAALAAEVEALEQELRDEL